MAEGLDRDIPALRAALGDEDAWAQEFELQWLDEASAWLSYDLIGAAEHPLAGEPAQYAGGPCFVGVDIARRKDLFVIWVLEAVGDVLWTREVIARRRISFAEQDALPLRLGRYGPEATQDDVRTLMTAVANIGTDAAAVLPKSMEIEFQKTADGAGAGIFETMARWVDEQVSKAVLGQTMTADNGSSMAQAKVHNDVRLDIAQADARGVEATVARDLVRPFVDLNFGVQEAYPRLRIVIPEPDDIAAMVNGVKELAPLGVRFKAAELRAKLGLSEPGEHDETIGGATAPADDADAALNRLRMVFARNRAEPPDPFASLDRIEADAALRWREEAGPLIEPILRLAAEAGGYDEFRRRLPELLEEMEIGPLVDGLVAALFQARAEGEMRDV